MNQLSIISLGRYRPVLQIILKLYIGNDRMAATICRIANHFEVDYSLIHQHFRKANVNTSSNEQASLLLVDDDIVFCQVLGRALEKRGYAVTVAHSVEQAIPLAQANPPEYAVVDLKMDGASGLVLVQELHTLDPATRIVMLTGYASIATAVEAIKLGATQYLAKPANADEIVSAFGHLPSTDLPYNSQVISVERLEWEHINRVLHEHNGNISVTARALNMHRRTLQRKLARKPAA